MHKERLKELRRVVEAAPEERFEMKHFCTEASCGTAYCAAGWAAIDPWFQENTEILDIFDISIDDDGAYVEEKDDGATFEYLAEMFDISPQDTTNLFGGNLFRYSKTVPKGLVLKNIDSLLKGRKTSQYIVANQIDD